MKRGQRYDHAFKLEAIKLVAERGMTKTEARARPRLVLPVAQRMDRQVRSGLSEG